MMPRKRSFNLDKLYEQVDEAYANYPSEKLDDLFETKSRFLEEIAKVEGGNDYKKPHKKKTQ